MVKESKHGVAITLTLMSFESGIQNKGSGNDVALFLKDLKSMFFK